MFKTHLTEGAAAFAFVPSAVSISSANLTLIQYCIGKNVSPVVYMEQC